MRKFYFLLLGLFLLSAVKAQILTIPDANFKAKLLSANSSNEIAKNLQGNFTMIDTNQDGEIQVDEALEISFLRLGNLIDAEDLFKISSLEGISYFTNLEFLNVTGNKLTSIDINALVKLKIFDCQSNRLASLDLSNLTNLEYLDCGNNNITSLDVKSLVKLKSLNFYNNEITSIDLSTLVNLEYMEIGYNKYTSLDLTNLSNLKEVLCQGNDFLTSIFMKNGSKEKTSLGFWDNLNLRYICADENNIYDIQNMINDYGYTNCSVSSYCSFVPGGTFYTIKGNNTLDINSNGCDTNDGIYPKMKYSITNGVNSGSFISNSIGNYSIPVLEGTHTITPIFENPSYFNASPASTMVTFPTQTSPFIQDFCITPNGIYPDLEVTILPILRARPGFDASYKIIYKNKGTITQSGSVKLTFDDAVLDVVAANPVFTSQSTDNLSWEYTNLKPFETRVIEVTLNVNSPMEIPALNIDDRLSFTALINPVTGDEQPVDNSFALRQLVVGSYDPNDKTCLEGSTIAPSAVGKYVHYMIRFENKGTAEAENVVIKDLIDTGKFDISSLVVTEGSHPFVTKISDTNKVEFIFEKINLPFEDATNDGYVAFKIKTKPSLVLGDSFSNTASIYFDYNFPIITNTATTSVLQSLGTNDFEFSTFFNLYPNPAKQLLNIDVKKQIELSSISIFNTLGQQIVVIPNAQQTKQVDVSNLKTGNYFIKVTSNKGSSSGKFIKD
ncbi:T9SS type A sorting domain-containing protein [Flavobacterium luteum]|uniref:T9SS type A sorting domain-containing protein n=1 Tax=Flavobacterium luteum TaxID=2026654 RepID=A0A7J5AKE7_9FLAO|nr:T9SS type A sorting domain-containing protein [Flavobacterium luteum]KAB1158071.1 T9SS type A sorting domain-containing protein [Flavobacterium luteum]